MRMRNKVFENIVKMTQEQLKDYVKKELQKSYKNVESKDGYVFAKGTCPVLLVAHMDTVHIEPPKKFCYKDNGNIISSPQGLGGDDRNGVYMILKIIKEINCSVLFVEDEEIGSIGARKFTETFKGKDDIKINYIIELDRRGSSDAVYYELDNMEFENFITENSNGHFKTDIGSFSDICVLAPYFSVAAVNLSSGYYKEHTLETYTVYSEMQKNIEVAKEIIKAKVDKPFEWKERIGFKKFGSYGFYDYGFYDEDDDYEFYGNCIEEYVVRFVDRDGAEAANIVEAVSPHEAMGYTVDSLRYLKGDDIISAFVGDDRYKDTVDRWYFDGKEIK